MIFKKYLWGPVLLLQGMWVRKKTPPLPEPVTQTAGTLGDGKAISLLLLGDSSAAGVGVITPEASLLGQLVENLCLNHQVRYRLMAKTGQTTIGMIDQLKSVKTCSYDVVVTALGVNDITTQVSIKNWIAQQYTLIKTIKQQFSPHLIIVSGLPPVRDFPALPWPLSAYMGDCADAFNGAITELCQQLDGVVFQSLRGYPDEAKAAIDGFHPGPRVYALWAEYLSNKISKAMKH